MATDNALFRAVRLLVLLTHYAYLRVWRSGSVVIGITGRIRHKDEDNTPYLHYLSFSPDPSGESHFDQYGILDDDVFHYLSGLGDVCRLMLAGNDTFILCDGRLVHAEEVD